MLDSPRFVEEIYPVRILHALSQTELTGSEVYAFELAQYQTSSGHKILSISDQFHKEFPGVKLNLPLSTRSFWQRMRNILDLRRILKTENIDVIHCHSRGACRNLFWASLGLKIPLVTTIHGLQHGSFSKKTFDIFGDYIFAVCEKMRDQQVENFGRSLDSIEVLRNPIQLKKSLPKESTTPRILLMGRNSGPKGKALRALLVSQSASWIEKHPDLEIRVILSGLSSEEASLLQKSFPSQVKVQGFTENPLEEMNQADLVVGAGRVAVEALLLGKSVLGLGEAQAFGMITSENWTEGLKSNFGDAGTPNILEEDLLRMSDQILAFFSSSLRPKIDSELLEKEYGSQRINERILEVYRAERFRKKVGWIPILMYHKVVTDTRNGQHRIFIRAENFRKHIQYLKEKNFQFLSFQDLSDYWNERKPLSKLQKNRVLITFDDGYRNNLENVFPVLQEFHAKATIFLLADHSILSNSWDAGSGENPDPLLTLQEKQSLDPQFFEVGSHGLRHERLPPKSSSDILSELRVSKTILEHDLKRTVPVFAYAFGDIDERLPELAKKAGYQFAVNTDQGPVEWTRHPWSLFRVSMFPEDDLWALWKKTSKWYRRYYFKKRGR